MLLFILSVHLVLLLNTRFTLWPEMTVYPYLLNNGFVLYRDIINPYPPTFIWVLSFFSKLFGYNPLPFQIFTWILVLIVDASVYIVAKRVAKSTNLALITTTFFVILSIPFGVNGLWFDLAQTPFIIFSLYYFFEYLKGQKDKNLIKSFFLMSVAVSIKQQALWIAAFLSIFLILRLGKKPLGVLGRKPLYFAIPLIAILLLFLISALDNAASQFLFWTVYFPLFKASQMPGYILLPSVRQLSILIFLITLFLPLIISKKEERVFVFSGIVLFTFAYPRFDYFHLIPALALFALVLGQSLKELQKSKIPLKFVCALAFALLLLFTTRFVNNNWTKEVRFFEKDLIVAAQVVENTTEPKDRIYIQNGPDQILPLANRLPPKPWADEFPWYLEVNNVQGQILEGIKKESPKYVIYKPYEKGPKFQIGAYRPQILSDFLDKDYRQLQKLNDSLWLNVKNEY